MIELRNVTKVFNAGKSNEFTAVRDVSLAIEFGKVSVLKGPSGSGKTTLLGLVGGMARPTSGRIFLDGKEITSLPERFLTGIRRKTYGFIFQHFNLVKGITVLENVLLPAYPTGEPHAAIRERGMRLLAHFNLEGKALARAEWLSGGEAQRTAIARALINDPAVLIADEPTAHLDMRMSLEFMDAMARLLSDGKTIVVASHDPVVFESRIVADVVEMRDGAVVHQGGRH
jgi:putative ABC transport system ATP-binding protein